MSEVEYDLLLEAVQTAIAPAPEDDFVVQTQRSYPSPRAANDNRGPLAAGAVSRGLVRRLLIAAGLPRPLI
jgi:hypothetical protein